MSVVARRAFALVLLAGAVGAFLALPAIFDGAQLASRGLPPVSTDTTTTHVFASLPSLTAAKPRPVVAAQRLAPAGPRPVARRASPVVRTRAHVVAASPDAALITLTPPAVPPAAAPAPAPPVSAVPAEQTADKVIASTVAPTTPPAESDSGPSSGQQDDHSADRGNSQQGDRGNGNDGQRQDNSHGEGR